MASYIPVPRDLSRVKTKVLFNLTKRQLLCFGAAALIGVPSFFLLRKTGNNSITIKMKRLNPLDRDAYRHILTNPITGILPGQNEIFQLDHGSLEWDEDYVEAVIDRVAASEMGARCARTEVDRSLGNAQYDMLQTNAIKVRLHVGTLFGEPPILIYR